MLKILFFVLPIPRLSWLLAGMLWLLVGWNLAYGQTAAPFEVRVTPAASPVSLPATGSLPLTASAVYPAFIKGLNGPVNAIAVQADGKIVVGGTFTQYVTSTGSTFQRLGLARLNVDGSLDQNFSSQPTIYFTSPTVAVYAIAIQPDGEIIIGGSFTYYNISNKTTNNSNIARLHGDSGTIDSSFGYSPMYSGLGGGFNGAVRALTLQPDGSILVGGEFTKFTISSQLNYLVTCNYAARLLASGTLDINFALAFVPGFNNYVYCLAVQPDGHILVGGAFTQYTSNTLPTTTRNRLARLNTNGTLDATYAGATSGGPTDGIVYALAQQPDGKVLVGGNFATYGGAREGLARVDANGNLDSSFPVIATAATSTFGSVASITLQADGKAVVGGNFTTFSGVSTAANLTRFQTSGSNVGVPEAGFNQNGSYSGASITAVAVRPNGQLLIGRNYNGLSKNLECLNATDGSINITDTPVPNATYVWSNGSNGSTLTTVASGTYSATATSQGLSATSNTVVVTSTTSTATYSVRVTPTGPMRLCPGTKQVLTAQAVNLPAGTLPASVMYKWWRVQGSTLTQVSATSTDTVTVTAGAAGDRNLYVATVDISTARAASPTVAVTAMPAPRVSIASGTTLFGAPGTVLTLTGNNLDAVTDVRFGPNASSPAATFTHTTPTELRVVVPSIDYAGPITVQTPCASASTNTSYSVRPTITSFAPSFGPAGTVVTVRGSGFTPTMAVELVTADFRYVGLTKPQFTVVSDTEFTVTIPANAAANTPTLGFNVIARGETSSTTTFVVTSSAVTTIAITTSTTQTTPYTNLVIVGPGNVTLTHDLNIAGNLFVQNGATLNTGLYKVTGSGNFKLEAGGTLLTSNEQGFSISGARGAIQLTGTIRFSNDASYGYTGTTTQVTGDGLPDRVRNLRCANSTGLTLSSPVAVAQVLTLASTGNLLLNNNMLTLLSGPDGTALVYNQGTGVVVGAATAQRYIDPTVNPTAGFRYYGAPVHGATASQLPASVFSYDESRVTSSVRRDTTAAINYGFVPTALLPSTGLEPGRGYRAAVPAATTVSFVGTLTTDTLSLRLTRSTAIGNSGWHLVSNPYPSPLSWKRVKVADRVGIDAAIYVYESTGPGTGYFRSYVNDVGSGDSLIAAGQAFFVRVSTAQGAGGTGRLRFRNSQRITTFDNATQPVFNRPAQTLLSLAPEFALEMERNGSCRPCRPTGTSTTQTPVPSELSRITVYTPTGATTGFDPLLDADAGNLFSPAQQTLGMRSGPMGNGPDTLAVQALPGFSATTTTEVLLTLSATAPGTYSFTASAVSLPDLLHGASAYLRDASTTPNLYTPLADGTVVSFTLSAAELLLKEPLKRFYLYFGPAKVLATTSGSSLQGAAVYPNPAHEHIGVAVPAVPGARVVQATLLNTLGQVLLRQEAALPATGTTLSLPVPGLVSGVYILRLQAGSTITVRRVVLE